MFKIEIEQSETLHSKYGTAKISDDEYCRITTAKEGNYGKLLHRLIFEDFYGPIPEGCHIHHKDGNPLNNCIMNLQLLTAKEHHSLHKKGENRSEETRKKISESMNSTGYFRVYKNKNSNCKQGFTWRYIYFVDGKEKTISSVDINELEEKVKEKELPWKKFRM